MSTKDYPSIDYIRQCFRYEDGRLFWRERPREHFGRERSWKAWKTRLSGKEAGCPIFREGHYRWVISVGRWRIYRYRLVWFFCKGEWCDLIDHENRNPLDDRIENLRPATNTQNHANVVRAKHNTSGFKGVSRCSAISKWRAVIVVSRKHHHLGYFDDPAEAHAAYVEAVKKRFGEFFCAG